MLLCKSTEPPRPPPLNNAHIATTLMSKLTLVRHVPHCISRAVGESVPRRETFVITKNLMARKPLLFWRGSGGRGLAVVGTLRLVINKINQTGAAISGALLDWIIVFL